ncbi:MAG TPA: helix-turn-helix transcriptional regulator [Candidatus Aphodovivens excrementavium]|nr:helix-turn-helix transcriptional regulator [Candidatus Aphodovivens excrementavium]
MPDEMMMLAENEALTADEVASMLQVSKNTVYNLVKRDELASYHVGRKMRFTRADVLNYVARSRKDKAVAMQGRKEAQSQDFAPALAQPQGFAPALAQSVAAPAPARETAMGAHAKAAGGYAIAGNDIVGDMLANYLGAVEVPIKRVYEGSYHALTEAYFGRAQAALAHIYDGVTGQYNVPAVQRLLPGVPLQVVRLVKRRQGFIVQKGNPKALRTWADLWKPGVRIANRERGCSSRILLDQKLAKAGLRRASLQGYAHEFPSALTMASVVARGGADVGIGAERVFHQVEGIDFLPLQDEWLDIVLVGEPGSNRVAQAIVKLARTKAFKAEVAAVAGYDTSHMGEVVYEQ